MNITGDRIKELRLKNNLTQEELGNKLGVKKAAINKYELGVVENIKRKTLLDLAEALNTSPNYLMGWEDSSSSDTLSLSSILSQQITTDKRLDIFAQFYDQLDDTGKNTLIEIIQALTNLNDVGIREALKRVEELTYVKSYKLNSLKPTVSENSFHYNVNAAHAIEGSSEEDKKHDDAIMEDDNF